MSQLLRVIVGLAVVCYFGLIVYFLKKGTLSLKYSLLWLCAGLFMAILILFSKLLELFVNLIDIKTPVNGLFVLCIFFVVSIMMSLTAIVSKQNNRIKCLVQDNVLLEVRMVQMQGRHQYKNAGDSVENNEL